jgi:transcriptional regulator with XRE-family HTH domain
MTPEFTLGDRLRKARELTGLDQGRFAEEIGVSRQSVSNAETETRKPIRVTMRAWALRAGVSLSWLEHGTVPSPGEEAAAWAPRDSNPQPTGYAFGLRLVAPVAA